MTDLFPVENFRFCLSLCKFPPKGQTHSSQVNWKHLISPRWGCDCVCLTLSDRLGTCPGPLDVWAKHAGIDSTCPCCWIRISTYTEYMDGEKTGLYYSSNHHRQVCLGQVHMRCFQRQHLILHSVVARNPLLVWWLFRKLERFFFSLEVKITTNEQHEQHRLSSLEWTAPKPIKV